MRATSRWLWANTWLTAASFSTSVRHELAGLFDYAGSNLLDEGNTEHPICALAGLSDLPAGEAAAALTVARRR